MAVLKFVTTSSHVILKPVTIFIAHGMILFLECIWRQTNRAWGEKPRSKRNRATPATFFEELLTLSPGYLLINGDFNFHMDVSTDTNANTFKDQLESAGLKQHVDGPTHRSGHTLDLIIDRQEDKVFSSFSTLRDLPSDHYAVLCSVAFAKPALTKS